MNDNCAIFPREESKGGRAARVIYLSEKAHAICQRLRLKYPEDSLFRNKGQRWTAQSLAGRCDGFTAYQLRHCFITNAILRDVDIQTLAVLVGHSDVRMISRVYSHLQRCSQHLRSSLQKIVA